MKKIDDRRISEVAAPLLASLKIAEGNARPQTVVTKWQVVHDWGQVWVVVL